MRQTLSSFFIIVLCLTYLIADDSRLELIHADKTIGVKQNNEQLRIFTGNVHFQQDTLDMYCQQAIYFEDRDLIKFIGQVRIDNKHRLLRADSINYQVEERIAECMGRVRISGDEDSLYAENFTYNFLEKNAKAAVNVYLHDYTNRVQIWGQRGFHDAQTKHSLVQEQAQLVRLDSTRTDTLVITARQLEYFGGDSATAIARGDVVIEQGQMRAVCDTAYYYSNREIAWLQPNPTVWHENNELSGVRMQVFFDSLKVRRILVFDDARARSLADSLKMIYNTLTGKEIEFHVLNDKPQLVVAKTTASSIYYLEDEGEDQGNNYSTADTIYIYFKEGELDRIRIIGGAEGIYYPSDYKGEKAFAEDQSQE